MIAGLVLAAGAGSRFGGAKLLAELGGRPLVEHALATMAAAPLDRVAIVLGADAERISAEASLAGADVVECPRWAEGQSASLRAGVAALGDADAIVVTLGDQPLIAPAAIERLLEQRMPEALAVRATYAGVPSHPTLIERPLIDRIGELTGDAGAAALFDPRRTRLVACDGLGSANDVDTPADLEHLRARIELSSA